MFQTGFLRVLFVSLSLCCTSAGLVRPQFPLLPFPPPMLSRDSVLTDYLLYEGLIQARSQVPMKAKDRNDLSRARLDSLSNTPSQYSPLGTWQRD
jgi:hypothetical protein